MPRPRRSRDGMPFAEQGERMERAAVTRGFTASDVAALLKKDDDTVRRWYDGQNDPPASKMTQFALAVGVSERWLVTGTVAETDRDQITAMLRIFLTGVLAGKGVRASLSDLGMPHIITEADILALEAEESALVKAVRQEASKRSLDWDRMSDLERWRFARDQVDRLLPVTANESARGEE
jgi:transcriptional regulator with XRE-family HTH domain